MMTQQAYRGYLIKQGFDGYFHVSREGYHITSQPSLEAAKAEIDNLIKLGLNNQHYPQS